MDSITPKCNQDVKIYLTRIFTGSYKFIRKIDSANITINGTADFVRESDHLIRYNESGSYAFNSGEHSFSQVRYFVVDADFLRILTHTKDIIHTVRLAEVRLPICEFSHCHSCNQDEYLLKFYLEENVMIMNYQVRGPSKNYNIETYFARDGYMRGSSCDYL